MKISSYSSAFVVHFFAKPMKIEAINFSLNWKWKFVRSCRRWEFLWKVKIGSNLKLKKSGNIFQARKRRNSYRTWRRRRVTFASETTKKEMSTEKKFKFSIKTRWGFEIFHPWLLLTCRLARKTIIWRWSLTIPTKSSWRLLEVFRRHASNLGKILRWNLSFDLCWTSKRNQSIDDMKFASALLTVCCLKKSFQSFALICVDFLRL